jgi:diacylglycerol kinase family enzyme
VLPSSSWIAIVNAAAGPPAARGRAALAAERLRQELGAEVVWTEGPGHATEVARSAVGYEGVAVWGGDGTVAEVVNGLAGGSQPLLVLPGGTANGLARELGVRSLDEGLAAARRGRVRRLDLLDVEAEVGSEALRRLAVCTVAFGFAAEAAALASGALKRIGAGCYPLASSVQALRQGAFEAEVWVDGRARPESAVSSLVVANTRHAGNLRPFEAADPADGLLHLLVARAAPAAQLLHGLAVVTRTYFYRAGSELAGHVVEVRLPTPQRLMLDGEVWSGVRGATVRVQPAALACVA